LTPDELAEIDAVLLEKAGENWRKVALLVAHALIHFRTRWPDVPDVYYSMRVRRMVEFGKLESRGNLARMRFSEVRIVGSPPGDEEDADEDDQGSSPTPRDVVAAADRSRRPQLNARHIGRWGEPVEPLPE
jgi:hypothetical protein